MPTGQTNSVIRLNQDARDSTPDWNSFRGNRAKGVAAGFPVRTTWNADKAAGDVTGVLWTTRVPGLGHSSPVIRGDRIFLATAIAAEGQAPLKVGRGGQPDAADDNGEQSWVVLCYDRRTGQELWQRTARQGTPRATRHAKATHANTSIAVDGDNPVPTPFEANGWIYITNAHGAESPIFVVRPDASGDVSPPDETGSNDSIVWSTRRGGSYMSTPVVYGDFLYLGNTNGVVRCFHARTGEKIYEKRLGAGAACISSLVAACGAFACCSKYRMTVLVMLTVLA